MRQAFVHASRQVSNVVGSPFAFLAALAIVIGWAVSGPAFSYGDTWQLAINTGTTIVTFLMVFLIQGSQNHDTAAIHAKLDELITHTAGPRDEVAGIEERAE